MKNNEEASSKKRMFQPPRNYLEHSTHPAFFMSSLPRLSRAWQPECCSPVLYGCVVIDSIMFPRQDHKANTKPMQKIWAAL